MPQAKNTGIVQKIDKLGRIVLPKKLRDSMGLTSDDSSVEIYIEDGCIMLQPRNGCQFCGECDEMQLVRWKDFTACLSCISQVEKLARMRREHLQN